MVSVLINVRRSHTVTRFVYFIIHRIRRYSNNELILSYYSWSKCTNSIIKQWKLYFYYNIIYYIAQNEECWRTLVIKNNRNNKNHVNNISISPPMRPVPYHLFHVHLIHQSTALRLYFHDKTFHPFHVCNFGCNDVVM